MIHDGFILLSLIFSILSSSSSQNWSKWSFRVDLLTHWSVTEVNSSLGGKVSHTKLSYDFKRLKNILNESCGQILMILLCCLLLPFWSLNVPQFPFIGNVLKRVNSTILQNPPFVSHRRKLSHSGFEWHEGEYEDDTIFFYWLNYCFKPLIACFPPFVLSKFTPGLVHWELAIITQLSTKTEQIIKEHFN